MDGTGSMKHCACCGKVVPNNSVCGDCKDTYYCSKECQKKARPGHKLVCAKDEIEKDVLRAGWLINKLHFAARGHASDIMFHSWHWDTQRKRLWITYNRFPGSLIKFSPPEGTTEEERKMILSAMFCKAATAFYSDLLKTILEGVPVVIHEVDVALRPPKKDVRMQERGDSNWSGHHNAHGFFQVSSTQSDRRWYIDLTGSQYGIHKPVHEVNEYSKSYVERVRFITPRGTFKAQLLRMGGNTSFWKLGSSIAWCHVQGIADVIRDLVHTRFEMYKTTKSQFLLCAVNDYQKLEVDVVRSLDQYVAETDQDRFAQRVQFFAMANTSNKDKDEKERYRIQAANEREMEERWPASAFPQSCGGL